MPILREGANRFEQFPSRVEQRELRVEERRAGNDRDARQEFRFALRGIMFRPITMPRRRNISRYPSSSRPGRLARARPRARTEGGFRIKPVDALP